MRYRLDEMFDEEFEHVMAEIRGAGTRQEAHRIIREHRPHLEYLLSRLDRSNANRLIDKIYDAVDELPNEAA